MKALLLALALVRLTHLATAQNRPEPAWEPITKLKGKHSLGINTQFTLDNLLDQNQSLPLDIRYKYFRKENRAWRAGVQLRYQWQQMESTIFSDQNTSELLATLAIGKEYLWFISPRWILDAGGDVFFSYRRVVRDVSFSFDREPTVVDHLIRHTHQPGLRASFGAKFFITPSIYVNAESSLIVAYFFSDPILRSTGTNSRSSESGIQSRSYLHEQGMTGSFQGLSNLSLNILL